MEESVKECGMWQQSASDDPCMGPDSDTKHYLFGINEQETQIYETSSDCKCP